MIIVDSCNKKIIHLLLLQNVSIELKFQKKKNPCPFILITWFLFQEEKRKSRQCTARTEHLVQWKDEITLKCFLQISRVGFFDTVWMCCRNIAPVKSKYLCLPQILVQCEIIYLPHCLCYAFTVEKRVGNDFWFVAQFLLAFLLHHVYIICNLCVYSFLGHCRTPTSVFSFNPSAKFIRVLSKNLRLSSRLIFKGCL